MSYPPKNLDFFGGSEKKETSKSISQNPNPTARPNQSGGGLDFFGGSDRTPVIGIQPAETVEQPGTWGTVVSTVTPVLEFLSRGQYASAKFVDSLANESKGILESLLNAGEELISPKDKLSYSDVIKKNAPQWAKDNPKTTAVLGFLGDVALDPTTYLGVGMAKTGVSVGGKALSKVGAKEFSKAIADAGITLGSKASAAEVTKTAEQIIMSLAESTPDMAKKLFAKEGVRATFFGKDIPGSAEALNAVGLNYLKDQIKNVAVGVVDKSKTLQAVAGVFSKNYGLADEYVQLRTGLENQLDYVADDVIRETKKLISFPEDRRQVIGKTMAKIDDTTRMLEETAQGALTQGQYQKIVTDGLAAAKLTPEEQATTAVLFQRYKEAGQIEMQAGLLKQMNENYSPRYYEVLGNSNEINSLFQAKQGLSSNIRAGKKRDFLTLAEAEANGFVPELDAAMIYASRMLDSRRKMAIKQFKDSVDTIFGTEKLAGLPPRVVNDLKMLGEAVYPSGMNDDFKTLLQGYDKLMSWFRRGATAIKPSFAPKQAVSNSIQSAMVIGTRAFKVFDPRAAVDAALLLNGKQNTYSKLPPFIDNLFSKHFAGQGNDAVLASRLATSKIASETRLQDYAAQYGMTTAFGQKISGTELVDEMRKHGIIKGMDITGDVFGNKLKRELSTTVNIIPGIDKTGVNKESVLGVAAELGKWWNHAAMTEDYARAMLYINGRKLGHSPEATQQLVNKALFDYGRGLSGVEKNVIRRIVPFYTFQRFALPLVFQTAATKPGVALTTDKTFKLFEKLLISGDSLSPSEQEIFGDSFLVSQPRVYRGFDKEGKATFNVLNSLTPLDVINLLEYNKDGSLNIQRSAEKGVLATLTPFIKVPLESIIDKNFFTGKTLQDAGKLGDLSKTKGYGTAEALYNYLPESIKDFIGWETRTNAISGKTQTYVNPYLAYWMQSAVPGIKTFIKPLNAGQSALDASMDIILGIPTVKMDLKQQQMFMDLGRKKELQEIKQRIRGATIKGSKSEADNAMDDYKRLMETIKQSGALRAQNQVRGGVVAEETPEASPVTAPER